MTLFARRTAISLMSAVAATFAPVSINHAIAETDTIRIATQFGTAYLPLLIVRNQNLIERHLAEAGLPPAKVEWVRLSGGAATNDALLSGTVGYVAAGIAPLLTIWDKTKGTLDVKAVAGLDASSAFLNTSNPNVTSLRDFTEKDRIALLAVNVSIQATMLQIAAEQAFGEGQHAKLDAITIALPHPDALAALVAGGPEITAHFTTPPFNFQELEHQGVHRVTSSHEIFGGPTTLTAVYATSAFRVDNPETFKAVFSALREGHEFIEQNPEEAARIFVEEEKSKLPVEWVVKLLKDPAVKYTFVPVNTQKIADFMYGVGRLKNEPESWRDYFFAELHEQPAS
ncbi:MAG: ABC transporter substrate-binding protein [Rhodospirillales bacterium]|nr:ABC transporter substrate-binding protein [Rhodospirillales bacterium]